jgi:hypothetical protein
MTEMCHAFPNELIKPLQLLLPPRCACARGDEISVHSSSFNRLQGPRFVAIGQAAVFLFVAMLACFTFSA